MKKTSRRIALAFLPLIAAGAAVSPAHARDREISVSGFCTRTATTDKGAIVITADFLEKELQSAVKKTTDAYRRANEAIQKLKLANAELQTVEYSVGEVREWEKNKSVFKGYRARMGLRVSTTEVSRISEVIAIAAQENLRDVSSLTTFLSDEKLRREQDACLKDAAEHAHAKAEKLASALNAKLGDVVAISESSTEIPRPRPLMPQMAAKMETVASDVASAPIQSGTQEVSMSVQATFGLK